jgi:hypothetical protein
MDNQLSRYVVLNNIPYNEMYHLSLRPYIGEAVRSTNQTHRILDGSSSRNLSIILNYEENKNAGNKLCYIVYKLPDWFIDFKGRRYIKLIGVHSRLYRDNIFKCAFTGTYLKTPNVFKDGKQGIKTEGTKSNSNDTNIVWMWDGSTAVTDVPYYTLHSNIAQFSNYFADTVNYDSAEQMFHSFADAPLGNFLTNNPFPESFKSSFMNYCMTPNQFLTPKLYQVPNPPAHDIFNGIPSNFKLTEDPVDKNKVIFDGNEVSSPNDFNGQYLTFWFEDTYRNVIPYFHTFQVLVPYIDNSITSGDSYIEHHLENTCEFLEYRIEFELVCASEVL